MNILPRAIFRYKYIDQWLTRNHPHARVLQIPAIVVFSLAVSIVAAAYGHMTPGTPSDLNDPSGMILIWILLCGGAAGFWLERQWKERMGLPPGCRPHRAWWSPASYAMCLVMFFVPIVAYGHVNALAIRRTVSLQPILEAYDALERFDRTKDADYRALSRIEGFRWVDFWGYEKNCEQSVRECLQMGFKIYSVGDAGLANWCRMDNESQARKTIERVLPSVSECNFSHPERVPIDVRGSSNMKILFAAHGVMSDRFLCAGVLKNIVLLPVVFAWSLGCLLTLAGVASKRTIVSVVLVEAVALALLDHNVFSEPMNLLPGTLLIFALGGAAVVLNFARTRTFRGDVYAVFATLASPLMFALALDDEKYFPPNVAIVQQWVVGVSLLGLALSSVTTTILNRYRYLPRV